jgi:hypothetical protein
MKKILVILITIALTQTSFGQSQGKRIWLSGAARNVLFFDQYEGLNQADTMTAPRLNSGHTMVDLAANIQPNSSTFIHGMVRIRNDYGGFWGAGVTFDVRQMYLKGIIANTVRYQIGDINYKLTPYTLINPKHDLEDIFLDYSNVFTEVIDYDLFYNFNNAWRQQGAAVDFGLEFSQYVSELKFNGFISRQNPSNFTTTNDRLLAGGNITMVQSKYAEFGLNYINMFDLLGTADDSMQLQNPVITGSFNLKMDEDDYLAELFGELGNSKTLVNNDTLAPEISDYFYDLGAKGTYKPIGASVQVNYKNVGPKFFSPGAQTRRLDYNRVPLGYGRYGNMQSTRAIGLMDMLRDASIYNTSLSKGLGAFNPSYGNATPYGDATPNRRGVVVKVAQQDEKERWNVDLETGSLSEIVGQGTANLRSFNYFNARVGLNVDKFLSNWKKSININGSFWSEQTTRNSNLEFEKVNLSNMAMDVNLDFEFIENGFLLAGYRMLTSEGNEYTSIRNNYNEVTFFTPFVADVNESLLMLGGRFEFSEKSTFSLIWSDYQSDYPTDLRESYRMNSMSIIFNMKF